MNRLEGKVAIVTGGAKGIGESISILFANEGCKVVVADFGEPSYTHENVEFAHLNITDVPGCKAFFDMVVAKYGHIDILVNNAGITKDGMTYKMTDDMWDAVISVNLKGVFNLTRYVGPLMEQAGKGSIINISSVVGLFGNIGQINYSASKAGVIGMTKTWAKEFARKGAQVRVNAIAPGYIMTDMMKTIPPELLAKFATLTMLGHLGQPDEVAKAALFLASDDASYVTGHVLEVSGGMRL